MKWQTIPEYPTEDTTIKHYRLLKFFGAQMFYRPEIAAFTFRFALFSMFYSPKMMQESKYRLVIPIPFMKNDYTIAFLKREPGR